MNVEGNEDPVMAPEEEAVAPEEEPSALPQENAAQADPAEWEAAADRTAADLRADIAGLAATYEHPGPNVTYRAFWDSVRSLNERIRLAPAIKLDDKFELQRTLNGLCETVRGAQRIARERAETKRAELQDALNLIVETLGEARTVDQVQEVRSDLTVMRERINGDSDTVGRGVRQELWTAWQAANGQAWERLNALWEENALQLVELLHAARRALDEEQPSQARQQIKAFHTAASALPTAHRRLRDLQSQANKLWQEAQEAGRKKHEAYLTNAGKRVKFWRARLAEHARNRRGLEREIEELQRRAATTTSDVGAALLRGQLAERQKALARLDAEARELEGRITRAEEALARG